MEAIGKQIMSNFLKIKREEAELYNSRPSNIDFDMYLDV
jgi:glutamine synthetase